MGKLKGFIVIENNISIRSLDEIEDIHAFPTIISKNKLSNASIDYVTNIVDSKSAVFLGLKLSETNLRIKNQKLERGHFFDGYENLEIYYIANKNDLEKLKQMNLETFLAYPLPRYNVSKLERALFLDRDGVINVNTHYPHIAEELQLYNDLIPIVKHFDQKGFKIIVTTNQSGIARGIFEEKKYFQCAKRIDDFFEEAGLKITEHYHCPYHIDGINSFAKSSILRKPMPGMFLKAAEDHQIDLANSVMIGDNLSDQIKNIPLKTYLIGEKSESKDTHKTLLLKLQRDYN